MLKELVEVVKQRDTESAGMSSYRSSGWFIGWKLQLPLNLVPLDGLLLPVDQVLEFVELLACGIGGLKAVGAGGLTSFLDYFWLQIASPGSFQHS